jgi:acylglycerol lipase
MKYLVCISLLGLLTGCATPPRTSVFSITDADRAIYTRLLSENDSALRTFTAFDLTKIAYRLVLPKTEPKAVVAFIHGTSAQSKLYLPFADTLAQAGFAVALLDLRGHGRSGGARGDVKNITALTRDVKRFLDTLRETFPSKKIALGGHSLGAGLCLKYVLDFYERKSLYKPPDALILMSGGFAPNPDCPKSERIEKEKRTAGKSFAAVDALQSWLLLPDMLLDFHPKPIEVLLPQDSLVAVALKRKELVTSYTVQFFLASFPVDIERAYRQVLFPTLAVVGGRDELVSPCDAELAVKKLRTLDKELLVLPESNHIDIIWTSAARVAAWLNSTLP